MKLKVSKESSLPLHLQLLDDLRHHIISGGYQPHERLPGELELSTELDISRATIQRAWQAAEDEGLIYRVPGKGTFVAEPRPTLSGRQAQAVGLLVPDFRGTFAAQILAGAEQVLRRRGYYVQLACTDYDIAEEDRLLAQMKADGVRGCIAWAARSTPAAQPHRLIARPAETPPIVLIDRPIPNAGRACVTSNNYMGGLQAMRHLLRFGHRDIVFLARPHVDLWTVSERLRAYQDALREVGILAEAPILIGDETELSSYEAYQMNDDSTLEPLLATLRQANRPSAIFAVNDWMALRALRAAQIAGLRVPEEVSIIGFDNLDVVTHLNPPLTTIRQNTRRIGAEAARRLLAQIEDHEADEDLYGEVLTLIPTELIVRGSTMSL